MKRHPDVISLTEFKKLLAELKETATDVCVRYRHVGGMWCTNFRRVIVVSERQVLFNDEIENRIYRVPDMSMIMQFEIDQRFQHYQPFTHYTIDVSNA